jgi:hypothetical protein
MTLLAVVCTVVGSVLIGNGITLLILASQIKGKRSER